VATISTGESAPTPPAEPKESDGEGAPPDFLDEVIAASGPEFSAKVEESQRRRSALNQAMPDPVPAANDLDWRALRVKWQVRVKIGLVYDITNFKFMAESLKNGRMLPSDTAHAINADGATVAPWMPIESPEALAHRMLALYADLTAPKAGDGATDPMQQRRETVVARLLALGFVEGEGCDTLRMFFGHSWAVPLPLPGHDIGPRKVEDMLDDAERLCMRMEIEAGTAPAQLPGRRGRVHDTPLDGLAALTATEPIAPGPTVAELQAKLAAERARADLLDAEAVSQRQRADAAEAQLRAIAALLDPEDSPTHDADDQPIPLPRRVEVALMPDPIGKSDLERRITKALDRYDAPKGFGSLGQASPYGRVLLTARENKQLKADKAALQGIIDDAEWIVHHCGSYGATASLADRILRLLPVERQRAVLELKRSEANIEVLRINARFLNPPPPGRLEEYEAAVATLDARIAALDAEKVQE
jgi:hypothetical protein